MNVFIFGGSFNPPHIAHVLAVTYVLSVAEADRVLVVPCYEHPLAKELAPYEQRVAMCERAVGWLPRTEISRVEEELGGASRSLRTLEHLHRAHPDWHLRFVVGADILLESERWYGFDKIVELAPLFVLGRAGVRADAAPEALLPEISSSFVRTAIREGRRAELVGLVPAQVLSYIEEHGIYR